MITDLILANAKAYYNKQIVDCAIAIENGEIFKIGKETQMPNADQRIDLRNLLLLPGLIDAHVHLRDEGKSYKEDFYSGTAAAAAGGVTTVLDMPNNEPVTMSATSLRNRMRLAEKRVLVNVGFYSEFPNNVDKVKDIATQGAVAFKLFMVTQIGGLDIDEDKLLLEAFEKVAETGLTIAVHAEDKASIDASAQALKRAKRDNLKAFLQAHSEQAELKAIERVLKISSYTEARLHVCHVTTEEGLNTITEAKQSGKKVTCEVTPHHLLLSQIDFERTGAMLAVMPPLRNSHNIEVLQEGVSNGRVDIIGSDHAPHTIDEKLARSIWEVKVGFPGLETTLPLLLTMVAKHAISLETLVRLLAEKPAEIFNIKGRGHLKQGWKADMIAVDLKRKFKIQAFKFHSKAKFSPFDGREVQGRPVKTFVNGMLVMDDQEIVAKPGSGSIIRSQHG